MIGLQARGLAKIRNFLAINLPIPFHFRCNICGNHNLTVLWFVCFRDYPSCRKCGSTLRVRTIVHALSMELFGSSIVLTEFPERRNVVGAGMSDWEGYATLLKSKFTYINTFYHQEPKLDIVEIQPEMVDKFDFLISSDVFEHVKPPVSLAFENLNKLLKDNGFVIFSVPYLKYGQTVEHFPELFEYNIEQQGNEYILTNTTTEGKKQVFNNLIFHGGEGSTLEMRVFFEPSLLKNISEAGLRLKMFRSNYLRYGIIWLIRHSSVMVLRRSRDQG